MEVYPPLPGEKNDLGFAGLPAGSHSLLVLAVPFRRGLSFFSGAVIQRTGHSRIREARFELPDGRKTPQKRLESTGKF